MEPTTKSNNPAASITEISTASPIRDLLCKRTLLQLVKYLSTGFISFGTDIYFLYLFTKVCHLWYIASNSLSLFIVFIINFTLNRFWAFQSKQPFLKQLITSAIVFGLNLVVGNCVMYICTDVVHLYYLYSKVIATGLSVTWNFFIYKYYLYK